MNKLVEELATALLALKPFHDRWLPAQPRQGPISKACLYSITQTFPQSRQGFA
jgi:hypothetical protein